MRFVTRALLMFAAVLMPASSLSAQALEFDELYPPRRQGVTKRYGPDKWQLLSLIRASKRGPAPLIAMVGRGCVLDDWMPDMLSRHGYAVACIDYRDPDEVGPREAAKDVARGIAMLQGSEFQKDIRPNAIAIMASGGAAWIAALIGTDPAIGDGVLAFHALKGVALVDPDLTDDSEYVVEAKAHVEGINAPSFYLLSVDSAVGRLSAATSFAKALQNQGTNVETQTMFRPDNRHPRTRFGSTTNKPTMDLRDYLDRTLMP
ncbi:hypothetical protein SAMN06295912_109151 [Sphingomonas laterariae]|uniref:Alpha/beta hydrolase n=1 Tax=Edaphosphingomonas laterariae TaxID=861865 RepID=A0A239FPL5_9SPHN|nr:hypothetical protein [Sphingomonas laterariae]SNS58851.1 hypothetical protein SAMN06295912_109151 [Sphingomonas laterariae]